jgi:dynein heavy chain, axonemal
VLKAAGNLRKADSKEDEDVQVLRAINEVNEAKFLSIDLPLFKAITGDLFPDTTLEAIDVKRLFECVDIVMKKRKLQQTPYFMEKILQLYQMILVRHGLMVVGSPYVGKSSWILVLADALAEMQERNYGEKKVEFERLNPKSVTNHQLYGITDMATKEWFDGVLPVKFKKLAISENNDRK